jgi:hypothetical protein
VSYVAAADRELAPHIADGRAIWRAYVQRELTPDYVPPPLRPVGQGSSSRRRRRRRAA